jgi:hypothetical protein
VNPYAFGRLAAALETAATSPDPAVRTRAAGKAARWHAVLAGMASGELTVGSRTPVADTPAWVTLEVLHGGFATGAYLAEQPVDAAERARLHPDQPGSTDRERVNLAFLGDAGQAELLAALATDRYRVDLPEHAALATVALLLDRGHAEAALDLLATLRPLLHRLRFTPTLLSRPEPATSTVHLRPAGAVAETLRAARPRPQIAAMRATLGVWDPLYDRLVALWADTVEGEPPRLVSGWVVGGWPVRRIPDAWAERRRAWLDAAAAAGPPTGRHAHPRSNFARLRRALEADLGGLTARDVGWVRRALANTRTAHPDRAALRAQQAAVLVAPTHAELARAVATGLDRYPPDGGVPSLDVLPAGTPPAIRAKVARALEAPVAELVERGVIRSGETLAEVLPQLTARHLAAGIADPVAAGLYARAYAAFRRRRSLLLLDLEHQVRFSELPWAAALEVFRTGGPDTAAVRAALRETVLLALTAFPATVLPNPLVAELGALATRAGLRLPLVEDVAADIFQGTFTRKWRAAAEIAGRVTAGSPYARYYDVPGTWPDAPAPRRRLWRRAPERPVAEDFAALCRERAREAGTGGNPVAANGAVLEQAAILTTANLAVLTDALDLGAGYGDLAGRAFGRAVTLVARLPADGHARLLAVKNAAYAWRQAVFFLGYAEPAEQAAVLDGLAEATTGGPLEPAVRGLRQVLAGDRFDRDGRTAGGGRRLLGWSVGPHWLLAPPAAR